MVTTMVMMTMTTMTTMATKAAAMKTMTMMEDNNYDDGGYGGQDGNYLTRKGR